MIEVFKWVNGINKRNINRVLEISIHDMSRGNGYKLEKLRFRTDLGCYWFTNKVVNDWRRTERRLFNHSQCLLKKI